MTIGSFVDKRGNKKILLLWYGYRKNVTRAPFVKKRLVLSVAMYNRLVEKIESFKADPE